MNSFEQLGLSEQLIKGITDLGFEQPTPIQEQAIPVLMEGTRDFMGLAQTGTGKTAAFGLPLLDLIDFSIKRPQALILAPTRELCIQISRDIENFSKYIQGVHIVAVYGGASIQTQISQIKRGVQIIVATPGRLLDLLDRRAIDISKVEYVVLDEADEMLNMGFQEDINMILSGTPEDKQTWLFSATMPPEVRRIADTYMTDPFELTVGKKNSGAENIEHIYYVVHARDKYSALKRIVDFNPDIFGIIFCRTRMETQEVTDKLIKDGYDADALHGDLSQQQRDKVMKRYREKNLQLLVATDVAARGIDVNNVTHVINYNLPDDIENYTHRSGRTARAGRSGISIVIINMKEIGRVKQIERQINKKFVHARVPDGVEVCERQLFHLINKIHDVDVNEKEIEQYLPKIYESLQDLSKEDLIKRFASIEFNRFLDYYKNAPNLNVDVKKQDFEYSSSSSSGKYNTGEKMFINLGSMDGFDVGSMLGYLLKRADLDKKSIGKIDIKGVYSFFYVEKNDVSKVLDGINGDNYKGRPVRVEISGGERGGDRGGRSRGGDRGDRGGRGGYGGGGRDRDRGDRGGDRGSRGGYGGGGSSSGRRSGGGGGSSRKGGGSGKYSDRWND